MRVNAHLSEAQGLTLTRAILIYEDSSTMVASLNPVHTDAKNSKAMIGAGRPLQHDAFMDIARRMQGEERKDKMQRSLLPQHVLAFDSDFMVWFLPSQRRRIFFNTKNKTLNAQVNGHEVLHPALLFMAVQGGGLYVFALADDSRPDASTQLFRAPYFNLYENGHMCSGSFRFPELMIVKDLPTWERGFFDTHFSHTNVDIQKLTSHQHGHDALWIEMAKTRLKRFPTKYLSPMMEIAPKSKKPKQMTLGKVLTYAS